METALYCHGPWGRETGTESEGRSEPVSTGTGGVGKGAFPIDQERQHGDR